MKGKVWIGTSGFSYNHWKDGVFYPPKLAQRKWLEYYSDIFNTVELNSPFYRLPKKETFKNWKGRVKEGFLFAVKGSRFITHIKKLKDVEESIGIFTDYASNLGDRLGPILFQLPPSLKFEPERLKGFLKVLPEKFHYSIEFRHPSWFTEEILRILKAYNIAFCISDYPKKDLFFPPTADFLYFRRHGPGGLYSSNYSDQELKRLAERLKPYLEEEKDVYVYFNNDFGGFAPKNALTLKRFITE